MTYYLQVASLSRNKRIDRSCYSELSASPYSAVSEAAASVVRQQRVEQHTLGKRLPVLRRSRCRCRCRRGFLNLPTK